ncbi:MAG: MFS transporter [Gemmatimonadota bacterium]
MESLGDRPPPASGSARGRERAAAEAAEEAVARRAPARAAAGRASFAEVLANPEFRAMWAAQLLSIAGDQLARVAMTILVYDRTRSPLLTAVTYAITFLPWLLGGIGLSGLADRLPRREVMITTDIARMALVSVMAVIITLGRSGAALVVMAALLFAVTLLDSPFKSARSALVADVLTGPRYALGTAVTQITLQTGIVAGFALGGVVVAAVGARFALLADAATFAASAVLLAAGVRKRPAAAPAAGAASASHFRGIAAGVRLVFGNPRLRTLMLLGWLVAFYAAPMSLAAPYAARFRGLPLAVTTGLVFAGMPLGTVAGAAVFSRLLRPAWQRRLMGPLAVAACAVLMCFWAAPGFALSLVLFAVAGACASYQVAANAAFVADVPAGHRGQAFGLANGGMQVLQGLWFIVAGAIASLAGPAMVIGISGGLGAVLAASLAISWRRTSSVTPAAA